jgi:hypothetical protein
MGRVAAGLVGLAFWLGIAALVQAYGLRHAASIVGAVLVFAIGLGVIIEQLRRSRGAVVGALRGRVRS